jgi:glycosyltransferase involved in cell wall biosynthesis
VTYSFILAVHNQQDVIQECIERLLFYSSGQFELLVFCDGCTDLTVQICNDLAGVKNDTRLKIYETDNLFETKVNNLGAQKAKGEYICFLQGDMLVAEDEWNERMSKPFKWNDIFAVTTKTAHDWILNEQSKDIFKKLKDYQKEQELNWCDILSHVNHRDRTNTQRDEFVIKECVNRGPLLMQTSELRYMGGFDSAFAPLDMDDHDLCYRVIKKTGKKVGLYWVNTYSDESWGATRKGGGKRWHFLSNQKNVRKVWKRHKDIIMREKKEEVRKLK